MNELLELLELKEVGEDRYGVRQPTDSAEGRDVVFSGQLLAQMIMAADKSAGGAKDLKSIHAVFARSGTYTLPIELQVEVMQSGRTWSSETITAVQAGKLLCRALALMSVDDPDLMRHQIEMPAVPGPDESAVGPALAYPGAEVRRVAAPEATANGVPAMWFWVRVPVASGPPAVHQAILSWATPGAFIELAMRPHANTVRISDAHRSVSTGVIGHTISRVCRSMAPRGLPARPEADQAVLGRHTHEWSARTTLADRD